MFRLKFWCLERNFCYKFFRHFFFVCRRRWNPEQKDLKNENRIKSNFSSLLRSSIGRKTVKSHLIVHSTGASSSNDLHFLAKEVESSFFFLVNHNLFHFFFSFSHQPFFFLETKRKNFFSLIAFSIERSLIIFLIDYLTCRLRVISEESFFPLDHEGSRKREI